MKPLRKFINVMIGVVVVGGIGFTSNNYEDIILALSPDSNRSDEVTVTTVEQHPSTSEVEPLGTEDHMDSNEISIAQLPEFSYDMEAINSHSIGHIYEMIDIVETYLNSPGEGYESLHSNLYEHNYIHFEDELNQKNEEIEIFLTEQLTYLKSIRDPLDQTFLESSLINMREVLENLTRVS